MKLNVQEVWGSDNLSRIHMSPVEDSTFLNEKGDEIDLLFTMMVRNLAIYLEWEA